MSVVLPSRRFSYVLNLHHRCFVSSITPTLASGVCRRLTCCFSFPGFELFVLLFFSPFFSHDTRVFLHAINTPALNFPKPPEGRYYLVDKGYPDKEGYLVPYPKIRYHQSQFEHEPPTNAQEAFNRAHSSLRSCIERLFGVLKKRWKILNKMPQFSVKTLTDVIIAAFALHNYIRINSQDDPMFNVLEQHPNYPMMNF
ncbi:hypothetical protein QL285_015340 [Trifolium repens]|nr:hypothetical protein QL285_015340 [Trifolium repens]